MEGIMTPSDFEVDKTLQAIQQTQEHMMQVRSLIADLPAEDRHGKFLRIFELMEIVGQGLDTIEDAIAGQESTEEDL